MRIIRRTNKNTRKNKIGYECLHRNVKTEPTNDKPRKGCLKWLGYAQRRSKDTSEQNSDKIHASRSEEGKGYARNDVG